MRRTEPVAPFLQAVGESIEPEPWRLAGGDELDGRVKHWDCDLTLRLERRVRVDVDLLLTSTASTDAGELAVATVWRSDRTRLKGPGMTVPLAEVDGEGAAVVTLGVDVPGGQAGGRLELQTVVIRASEGPWENPIAAHRPGSILWSDRVAVSLEGDAARFPVTVVDFSELVGIDSEAPWALEWYPRDLDQPVLGAMRLLVNSRSAIAVDAVGAGEAPESAAVASAIRFDVTRSLVHGALRNDDFLAGSQAFEANTVGRMLSDLLDQVWPRTEPATLAARLGDGPHRIDSELQAHTGLLAR